MASPLDVVNKALLDLWPARERSTLANRFLDPIRAGVAVTAEQVVAAVVTECGRQAGEAA